MNTKRFEIKENAASGCIMGMILFISAVLILGISVPLAEIQLFISFLPAVLIFYLALGIVLSTFHHRSGRKKRDGGMFLSSISGFSILGLVSFVVLLVILRTVSYPIRLTVAVNIVIVVIAWSYEYFQTVKIAREMNECSAHIGTPAGRSLVEPLDERPENTEQFLSAITEYCQKNRLEFEIVTPEKPAVVKLNGVYHLVSLTSWYGFTGPIYCLKFEEMD